MRHMKKLNIAVLICAVLFCSGYYLSGKGYLNRLGKMHMMLSIAPPTLNSIEQKRDKEVFLETRSQKNNARWQQAIIDATATDDDIVEGFSCAARRHLVLKELPAFSKLLQKTAIDTEKLALKSKKIFKVERPFKLYSGATCEPARGYDYPSGHAMRGWTVARLLVIFFPEQRSEIFAHARSFAESRVICGVHSLSAVEVTEDYSAKIIDRLNQLSAFQNDVKAVKIEMSKLGTLPSPRNSCEKFSLQYVKPFSSIIPLPM